MNFSRVQFSPSQLIVGGLLIVLLMLIMGQADDVFWIFVDFTLRHGG